MGYCIHCSPVYQVTYGEGNFSHLTAEINRLLKENCNVQFDGDDIEASERLEVPRTDLVNLVNKIANEPGWFINWLYRNSIDATPEEFIAVIKDWISDSDPRNDYVVLTWY